MSIAMRLSGECPKCRKALVRRNRRSDGEAFLGCSGHPNCKFTEDWDPQVAKLANEVAALRADMEAMRVELARSRTSSKVPADLDKKLREVIVYAHPDRWPQAQELATGVSSRLNVLRGSL